MQGQGQQVKFRSYQPTEIKFENLCGWWSLWQRSFKMHNSHVCFTLKLFQDRSGSVSVGEFLSVPELKENPLVKRVVDVFDDDMSGEVDFKGNHLEWKTNWCRTVFVYHTLRETIQDPHSHSQIRVLNQTRLLELANVNHSREGMWKKNI